MAREFFTEATSQEFESEVRYVGSRSAVEMFGEIKFLANDFHEELPAVQPCWTRFSLVCLVYTHFVITWPSVQWVRGDTCITFHLSACAGRLSLLPSLPLPPSLPPPPALPSQQEVVVPDSSLPWSSTQVEPGPHLISGPMNPTNRCSCHRSSPTARLLCTFYQSIGQTV